MPLKTFVKVSTVNNLSDARYCAGMEVDLIGFSLEQNNPNYLSPDNFKELTEWLSGVSFVGEFESYSSQDIKETIRDYNIQYLQVTNASQLRDLEDLDKSLILKISLKDIPNLTQSAIHTDYLLISGDEETLSSNDILATKKLAETHKVLLGVGINDANVEDLVKQTGVEGIALQGGDELRPGYKDYDELADILEALEVSDC